MKNGAVTKYSKQKMGIVMRCPIFVFFSDEVYSSAVSASR